MSKHKPKEHIYICLCDVFRPSRTGFTMQKSKIWERPYRGRYVVNAKNEKHAIKLLRKICPFGSLQIYYQQDDYGIRPKYGEVIRENSPGQSDEDIAKVYSVNDCQNNVGKCVEIAVDDCFSGVVKVIKVKQSKVLIEIVEVYSCYPCQTDPGMGERYWVNNENICKN